MRLELFSTRGFVLYRDLGTLLQERFISQHSLLQQRVEERFVAPGGGKQQRGQGGAVFRNRLAQARDFPVHPLDQFKHRGGGVRIRERRADKANEQRVISADPF